MSKTGFILLILTLPVVLLSQNVNSLNAKRIAQTKLQMDNQNGCKIVNTQTIEDEFVMLGYIFDLQPKGYIVISANSNLPPIIAYSYNNSVDNDKRFYNFLKTDLKYRTTALNIIPKAMLNNRHLQWNNLLSGNVSKDTTFQQWPDAGTTPTDGWLESNWTQNAPYNNMCPMDPVTQTRSYAGCPSVAMAMIVNFHKTTNSVHFDDNDDYYHNYAGRQYWIDDDFMTIKFPSWPDLNLYLDTLNWHWQGGITLTDNDKASLVFACGAAANQVYTSSGSGTFAVSQAYDAYQKFNFTNSELLYNTDTNLYTRIINNIKDTLPVHLAVVDSAWSSGHNVVIDGYNTDDYYHINFGWGGSNNGWYLLPDEIPYNLTVIEGVIVDIIPGSTVNIEHVINDKALVYPNPCINSLYIKDENITNGAAYSILSLEGKIIKQGCYNKYIDISALKAGMYFIIVSDQSKTIRTIFIKM